MNNASYVRPAAGHAFHQGPGEAGQLVCHTWNSTSPGTIVFSVPSLVLIILHQQAFEAPTLSCT